MSMEYLLDWRLFLTAYGLLFLAEFGDKTQLAVFTLAAENGSPLAVFLGATAALATVTAIGVLFGGAVAEYLPPIYLKLLAGSLFVLIGLWVLREPVSLLL